MGDLISLQATAGNRAVQQLLQGAPAVQRQTLYRGMQANLPGGTQPLVGDDAAFKLGVRDDDIPIKNADGNVDPGTGGMSTSKARASVPRHTVSKAYTSINQVGLAAHNPSDPTKQPFRFVWSFDDANLPGTLITHNDHDDHVMLEPKAAMGPAEFRNLVHGTALNWVKSPPP